MEKFQDCKESEVAKEKISPWGGGEENSDHWFIQVGYQEELIYWKGC